MGTRAFCSLEPGNFGFWQLQRRWIMEKGGFEMGFSEFRQALQKHFAKMIKDTPHLFEVAVDKDELWNLYLDSFPEGTNEIYRKCRKHDCSCCRHFIKKIGNCVAIKDNKIHTIWDLSVGDTTFQPVADALSAYLKKHAVGDVFVSREKTAGTEKNFAQRADGRVETYEHFYLQLPGRFVSDKRRTPADIKGEFRDTKNVFARSLSDITQESVMTVLELIAQNSLYRGEEWKAVLMQFVRYQRAYEAITDEKERENFLWEKSAAAGAAVGRIRNHSMGTLLINLSGGMDLDEAVKKYEQIVAPANYKRPKAVFTQKMLSDAKKKVEELGYMPSLARRFATLDDISINNILFSNRDARARIPGALDVFAAMEKELAVDVKKFSRVEEIGAENFVKNVLPTVREMELFVENRHHANLVSLIAPVNTDAPSMFKWKNGFSWAYSGNIADSDIKQNVKSAGGAVDGVLRFSIQWNDMGDWDRNDLDAHCKEPGGEEIMFNHKVSLNTGGELDVDIINPAQNHPAVENITWAGKGRMEKGKYLFFVHQYANRGGKNGFRAEVEFDGKIYQFDYAKELRQNENVMVAEVTFDGENFTMKELLPSNASVRELWGVKTNQFVPVTVVMYSPNYWDEQMGIGNRHYFFMLKDCVNDEMPNGMFNEYLTEELMEHKRVFEALGSRMHVEDAPDQLSGLGFSATRHNDVLVKVKGASERVMRVKF